MKKLLIVGNWKMNLNTQEASLLVHRLHQHIKTHRDIEVVLAPSMLTLQPVSLEIDRRRFGLAAQNAFSVDEGAYTGEVSFNMLRELVDYSIVGHSERRRYFNEGLQVVRDKVAAAVRNRITPILCVGETKQERAAGETHRVVHDQLTTALHKLTPEEAASVVVAYEPVWAIGTGDPEKPDDIKKVTDWIRHILTELYGEAQAAEQRILYGASVAPEFVREILKSTGVDGFLVGGASLNYQQFTGIVDGAYQALHEADHD
jgi:triosephosphate isomerase